MSEARWSVFLVILMCMMVTFVAYAQPTVDDGAFCDSSTFDEAVNVIREDVKDVKNLLESNQQQSNASGITRKDLEELKAACTSNQQRSSSSDVDTSRLCE